jgi:hypothetical protein
LVGRLEAVYQEHGFEHEGRTCVPFEEVARAVAPDAFDSPPEPDAAFQMPGGTPERLAELQSRAATGQAVFTRADCDAPEDSRLAAMLKPARAPNTDGRTRAIGRLKHYQVVMETHTGVKPLSK